MMVTCLAPLALSTARIRRLLLPLVAAITACGTETEYHAFTPAGETQYRLKIIDGSIIGDDAFPDIERRADLMYQLWVTKLQRAVHCAATDQILCNEWTKRHQDAAQAATAGPSAIDYGKCNYTGWKLLWVPRVDKLFAAALQAAESDPRLTALLLKQRDGWLSVRDPAEPGMLSYCRYQSSGTFARLEDKARFYQASPPPSTLVPEDPPSAPPPPAVVKDSRVRI